MLIGLVFAGVAVVVVLRVGLVLGGRRQVAARRHGQSFRDDTGAEQTLWADAGQTADQHHHRHSHHHDGGPYGGGHHHGGHHHDSGSSWSGGGDFGGGHHHG